MTLSLAQQQQAFAAAIMANEAPAGLSTLLRPTPQGGKPRFDIYHNAYRVRLRQALKENYPVLFRVLGDEGFAVLAEGFLAARPSRQPSIRWFGEHLAEHVSAHPESVPHPALADLIRMEWALGTIFDSVDAEPLRVADLLALPAEAWPELRFSAHPSLRLLALEWNVEPLWSVLSKADEDEEPETEVPVETPHHLLAWRSDGQTQWRSAEPAEAALLAACVAGTSFAELCELAGENWGDGTAAQVAGYLRVWVEAGLLGDFVQVNEHARPQ